MLFYSERHARIKQFKKTNLHLVEVSQNKDFLQKSASTTAIFGTGPYYISDCAYSKSTAGAVLLRPQPQEFLK